MFVQLLLQWKRNEYYTACVRICSLRHPACNAHGPYCHLWPAPLYGIFPHYLLIFSTILLSIKYGFQVSLQLLPKKCFILRRIERDMINNVKWSLCKVPFFLSDFHEIWVFSTDFRKILKYQISWKSVQWEPSSMRMDRQTDRHDEANSRFSQFYECAYKLLLGY